jgi:adenosylcobinamide kinase / adenosylcobinamide-phosphate guanylyltransferase
MAKLILITGGQRSGKSSHAQQLALSLSPNPIYLATSRIWDDEHALRIARHKADRDERWTNVEDEKHISRIPSTGRVVLVDCITLWLTNFFYDNNGDIDKSLAEAKDEFALLMHNDATYIVVSNEIGLGGMPENDLQRKFTDLQGWMNQFIAQRAEQVFFMVSGLPLKVK